MLEVLPLPGMPSSTRPATELGIDPDDIEGEYDRLGLTDLSDAQLFDRAADAVSIPKQEPANSFVLHAPLELMARRLLLPVVSPHHRRAARQRMMWVAAMYERAGDPVEPVPPVTCDSVADAHAALVDALGAGDLEAVDAAAAKFLEQATVDEIMELAGSTIDMLAAAGHAPIGFFLANRLATTSRSSLALLRPVLRELARAPQLRVRWVGGAGTPTGDENSFASALAGTPKLGLPGSDFIFPMVSQVDNGELARDLIEHTIPADVTTAAAVTLRVAAHSMLQDDPRYAPYGWTHCLTLPHAIFEIMPWLSDRHAAAAIAATYVVGFRAAEGTRAVETRWKPEPVSITPLDALDQGPDAAGASWYHASDAARSQALPELVGRAARHQDAHLVKYTLACLAAAARHRAERSLYLAAAASLGAWWTSSPPTAFRDDL
jgi:hypothetical protein